MVFTYVLTIKILCDNQKLMQSIVREHSTKARMRKERNGAYSTTYLTPNMYAPRFMERPSVDTSISGGTSINEISFPSNNDTLGDTKMTIHNSSSPPMSSQCSDTSRRKVSHDPIPEFVCAVQAPSPCLSAAASPQRLSACFPEESISNTSLDNLSAAHNSRASSIHSTHSWHDPETVSKHSMAASIEERLSQIEKEMDAFLQRPQEQTQNETSDNESIPDDGNLPEDINETCSLMKEERSASHHSSHSTPSHTSDDETNRPNSLMVPPVTVTSPQLTSSDDGVDDSDSENDSDLITIHLKATGCYMYKLDPTKSGLLGNSHNLKSPCVSHTEFEQDDQTERDTHDESDTAQSVSNDRTYSSNYPPNSPNLLSTAYHNGWKNLRQSFRRKRCKSNGEVVNMIPKRTASNEKKASKVLGIIFAVFVVLWTPFFIMNIIAVTCEPCLDAVTPSMMASIVWLGYLSSLANPIIYTMFNTAFRHAFYKILTCSYKKSMPPSATPDTMFLTATNQWATDNRRNTVTLTLRDTINW